MQGFDVLPKHCTVFMIVFFVAAIAVNVIRDFLVPKSWRIYIPIPMAVGVTFFLGVSLLFLFHLESDLGWIWRSFALNLTLQH